MHEEILEWFVFRDIKGEMPPPATKSELYIQILKIQDFYDIQYNSFYQEEV